MLCSINTGKAYKMFNVHFVNILYKLEIEKNVLKM